jgi:hypothetical protein
MTSSEEGLHLGSDFIGDTPSGFVPDIGIHGTPSFSVPQDMQRIPELKTGTGRPIPQ